MNQLDMNQFESQPWIAQIKTVLDESALSLDAATLSRLNRARQAAMAQGHRRSSTRWLPGGLATACVLMLGVGMWHARQPALIPDVTSASALTNLVSSADSDTPGAIVAADDSLEFYQDLEFYAWLDAQDADANG